MTQALQHLIQANPPQEDTAALWKEAIRTSLDESPTRRAGVESPEARMRRLRDLLAGELVAFHDTLIVSSYAGQEFQPVPGTRLWEVAIPLTLFPKREYGFTRVECLVEFEAETQAKNGLRILKVLPEARSEVVARAELGGNLELNTSAKLGLPVPSLTGVSSVAEVAGKVYASAEIGHFLYEARRVCVETEIVRGHGARWRLEDERNPERVGIESHQLKVLLEVRETALPVNGAGFLNAYSDTRWLTSSIGSLWRNFRGSLGRFFKNGLPAEAYAEWEDIIPQG